MVGTDDLVSLDPAFAERHTTVRTQIPRDIDGLARTIDHELYIQQLGRDGFGDVFGPSDRKPLLG
jgi:hypothetical protein